MAAKLLEECDTDVQHLFLSLIRDERSDNRSRNIHTTQWRAPLCAIILDALIGTGLCEDLIKQNKGESRYSTRSMVLIKIWPATDRIPDTSRDTARGVDLFTLVLLSDTAQPDTSRDTARGVDLFTLVLLSDTAQPVTSRDTARGVDLFTLVLLSDTAQPNTSRDTARGVDLFTLVLLSDNTLEFLYTTYRHW
ncbi:hypothetical protein J6590_064299 [Homalodisca vitripennis]|nr:hypothetical protein J6590_064299 [Homalodisca vitripennis]